MAQLAKPKPAHNLGHPQKRLGELVAESLVDQITSGYYQPGDKLPTETELEHEFNVSRTAIREGLKWVESRGLTTIRQGRGAEVNPIEVWDLTEPVVLSSLLENDPNHDTFEHLMAVRTWLEPELARQAATRITATELNRLKTLLDEMSQALNDPATVMPRDVEFHDIICTSASNLVARSIMSSIAGPLWITRRLMNRYPNSAKQAHTEHVAIFDALQAGDSENAATAMRAHLLAGLKRGEFSAPETP